MAIGKPKTSTRQTVKPATQHKKSMKSDQTTTQSNFMTVFMVWICGNLQALFSLSCGCIQVFYGHLLVTTHQHLLNKLSVSELLSE
jgi:hypothetical protein